MKVLDAPTLAAPDPILFSVADDVLHASFSMLDLYPNATIDIPVEVPRDPLLITGTGIKGRIKQAFSPIGFERPLGPPTPGFWSVFAHQRGLATGDSSWIRPHTPSLFRGRTSTSYATVMRGTVNGHEWTIAAGTQREVATSGRAFLRSSRCKGILVFSCVLPQSMIEDQRHEPSMNFPLGWSLVGTSFTAWMQVPASEYTVKGKRVATPHVSSALIDWACVQAVNAARSCIEAAPR